MQKIKLVIFAEIKCIFIKVKMDKTHIKRSFIGFAHRVTPFQNVFERECEADLDTNVLEFFSGLQKELVTNMMSGACAISQHRGSDVVSPEDLLLYLDMQWNLDPLFISANGFTNYYRVTQATDEVEPSSSPEPPPKKRQYRRLKKVSTASPKVKKNSAGKSLVKSKRSHLIKSKNKKSKDNLKSQVMCRKQKSKLRHLDLSKKSKYKDKKHFSVEVRETDLLVKFDGIECKQDACDVESDPVPVEVHKYKHKLNTEEKTSVCESLTHKFKENELKFEVPVWFSLDPKTNTYSIAGLRQNISVTDSVPKLFEESMSKLESKDGQSSTCVKSVNIPFKGNAESKTKAPMSCSYDLETNTFRIARLKEDIPAVSKQSPKASVCKPRSKVQKKKFPCKNSTKFLPVKVKTEPEFKIPLHFPFNPKTFTRKKIEIKHDASKEYPEVHLCKLESSIEEMSTLVPSIQEVFSLQEKSEPAFKLVNQDSMKIPCLGSQVVKMPQRKYKLTESDIKCASEETLEKSRESSIEMHHPVSNVHKGSVKRIKREGFGINNIPVETPVEARRRLASVLLRIAGKY